MTPEERRRYDRQLLLDQIGESGQIALRDAKVLIVGVGGLGCPVALYLAAAGVGTIGLMDGDVVDVSNLHRQVLFTESDLGRNKAAAAREHLAARNSSVQFDVIEAYLVAANAATVIQKYDVIVDASDNFPARYLINDICYFLGKPVVFGAVHQFEGQVSVFNAADENGVRVNYRDLFPIPPAAGEIPNCAEAGVLGVLPGIIGSVQANEVIKLILNKSSLIGKLLHVDAQSMDWMKLSVKVNSKNPLRSKSKEYFDTLDYDIHCGVSNSNYQIDLDKLSRVAGVAEVRIIDVRELDELPRILSPDVEHRPMSSGFNWLKENDEKAMLVFICRSGRRSDEAASIARTYGFEAHSLEGGVQKHGVDFHLRNGTG